MVEIKKIKNGKEIKANKINNKVIITFKSPMETTKEEYIKKSTCKMFINDDTEEVITMFAITKESAKTLIKVLKKIV